MNLIPLEYLQGPACQELATLAGRPGAPCPSRVRRTRPGQCPDRKPCRLPAPGRQLKWGLRSGVVGRFQWHQPPNAFTLRCSNPRHAPWPSCPVTCPSNPPLCPCRVQFEAAAKAEAQRIRSLAEDGSEPDVADVQVMLHKSSPAGHAAHTLSMRDIKVGSWCCEGYRACAWSAGQRRDGLGP